MNKGIILGQYFTDNYLLKNIVVSLCRNNGMFLEPSAGAGHLVSALESYSNCNITAIELDSSVKYIANTKPTYMDFFDLSVANKFDTVFGNPPFVKFRNINKNTIDKINSGSKLVSCNLFYYFIWKSFFHLNEGGEIVFIVPREFLNSSRAGVLRELLYRYGTITDIYDFGETNFFRNAAPNVIIFRYEKDNLTHKTNYFNFSVVQEQFINSNFVFSSIDFNGHVSLGDFFDVKVGLVTGCNKIFERSSKFSIPTICSDYKRTGIKKDIIFLDKFSLDEVKSNDPDLFDYMISNKEELISRKIKKFDESNWYCYGAVRNLECMEGFGKVIYVNSKTRDQKPFFVDDIGYFDGSMLCLIPKIELDLKEWCNILNNSKDEFERQNMYTNNKYSFTVGSLLNLKLLT
jgi:adenine-specific DNA-methyltransferase